MASFDAGAESRADAFLAQGMRGRACVPGALVLEGCCVSDTVFAPRGSAAPPRLGRAYPGREASGRIAVLAFALSPGAWRLLRAEGAGATNGTTLPGEARRGLARSCAACRRCAAPSGLPSLGGLRLSG